LGLHITSRENSEIQTRPLASGVTVRRAKEFICRGRHNVIFGLQPKFWVRKRERILRREWACTVHMEAGEETGNISTTLVIAAGRRACLS